jgi:ribosomal protein L7/L12
MQQQPPTIHQVLQRLDALEAQVASLTQALAAAGLAGDGMAASGQPEPMAGRPLASSAYGALGPDTPAGVAGAYPDVVQLARSGNKVAAIKLYRQYTNAGLQEAKYFVDTC